MRSLYRACLHRVSHLSVLVLLAFTASITNVCRACLGCSIIIYTLLQVEEALIFRHCSFHFSQPDHGTLSTLPLLLDPTSCGP